MSASWMVLIVVFAALATAGGWMYYGRNREVVSNVEVLNPGGESGTALVVYHPGKSDFQGRVFSGFAEGLTSNGWRAEITTASSQSPTDLSGCDLLVLGGPTYGFAPNLPIRRYIGRLRDLGGQRTVTIITALGWANARLPLWKVLFERQMGTWSMGCSCTRCGPTTTICYRTLLPSL